MLQTHLAVSTVIIFGASFLPSPNFSPNEKVPPKPVSWIESSKKDTVFRESHSDNTVLRSDRNKSGTIDENKPSQWPDKQEQQNRQWKSESTGEKWSHHDVINQWPQHPILQKLWLTHCDISQWELNHHKDWNGKSGGHVFATDIVCTPGEIFKVQAPDEYPFYLVQHIGTDQNLWTYVILKHWDVRFVLAHTDNRLEAGSTLYSAGNRINAGDTVGWVNESGNTGGAHLHIEKWIGKNNVTMSGDRINEFSSKLCQQRWWSFCKPEPNNPKEVLRLASDMIIRYEGYNPNAYWDVKWYSIGYGTPSFKGEKISKAEAKKRFEIRLNDVVSKVMNDFPDLSVKQQTALVSLAYNCWSGYTRIKAEWIQAHKTAGFCLVQGYSGLEKRRAEESKLLFQ